MAEALFCKQANTSAQAFRKADGDRRRVLIGSCGGLAGIYLAKRLSLDGMYCLYGADCSTVTPASFFVDEVLSVPSASDEGFVDALVLLLNEKEIDCYLPTHSAEMRIVAENERLIRSRSPRAAFLVSPLETFDALDDKKCMTLSLKEAGIPTPAFIEDDSVSIRRLPLFAKRRKGSGGVGARLVETEAALAEVMDDPDVLLYEYVKGDELTIDCMFDDRGKLLAYNQRKRIKTLGGAAIITQNDYSIDCEPWLRAFERTWTFVGCVNFQCIVREGTPFFTDINLRYPSGGMPLSVESGVDIPTMTMKLLLHEPIDPLRYQSDKLDRTMYRVFDELYEVV